APRPGQALHRFHGHRRRAQDSRLRGRDPAALAIAFRSMKNISAPIDDEGWRHRLTARFSLVIGAALLAMACLATWVTVQFERHTLIGRLEEQAVRFADPFAANLAASLLPSIAKISTPWSRASPATRRFAFSRCAIRREKSSPPKARRRGRARPSR